MAADSLEEVYFSKDRVFIGVDYPAVVKNVDKMLETLGGEATVAKTYSDPINRLELKFRPNDIYCKPVYGDRMATTRVLMKVKRRRKKMTSAMGSFIGSDFDYYVEIIGIMDHAFKFRCMADFQYLPMERTDDGSYKSLVEQLVPTELHSPSWLKEPAPLLLTPIIFSRIDNPCDYYFRKDPKSRDGSVPGPPVIKDVITRTRNKRGGFTIFANYDDVEVPDKPHELASKVLAEKFCDQETVRKLRNLFEERPIWTRNGLLMRLSCHKNQLKLILPAIAYYFITGPWRALWVKFGYDPRQDPRAKIYQLLDFRVRKHIGRQQVPPNAKRVLNYAIPIKFSNQGQARPVLIQRDNLFEAIAGTSASKDESDKQYPIASYIFGEDTLPPGRQTFYQLCDIHLEEVQKLIHANDGQEKSCGEKDGWCISGIPDKCRDIMTKHVMKLAAIQKQDSEEEGNVEKNQSSNSESEDQADDYGEPEEFLKALDT